MGFVDLMGKHVEQDHGDFLHSRLGFMPGVMPVASGGIHIWHMPALVEFLAIPACNSVVAPSVTQVVMLLALLPTGLLWKLASKPVTKPSLAREGNDVIREAKWSPELAVACELWKEIKFEFQAMDTI